MKDFIEKIRIKINNPHNCDMFIKHNKTIHKKHTRRNHIIDVCTFVHKTKFVPWTKRDFKLSCFRWWQVNYLISDVHFIDVWLMILQFVSMMLVFMMFRLWSKKLCKFQRHIFENIEIVISKKDIITKIICNLFTHLSRLDHEAFVLRYENSWLKCD